MRREVGAMAKVVSAKMMRSMDERLDARKPCHNLQRHKHHASKNKKRRGRAEGDNQGIIAYHYGCILVHFSKLHAPLSLQAFAC